MIRVSSTNTKQRFRVVPDSGPKGSQYLASRLAKTIRATVVSRMPTFLRSSIEDQGPAICFSPTRVTSTLENTSKRKRDRPANTSSTPSQVDRFRAARLLAATSAPLLRNAREANVGSTMRLRTNATTIAKVFVKARGAKSLSSVALSPKPAENSQSSLVPKCRPPVRPLGQPRR